MILTYLLMYCAVLYLLVGLYSHGGRVLKLAFNGQSIIEDVDGKLCFPFTYLSPSLPSHTIPFLPTFPVLPFPSPPSRSRPPYIHFQRLQIRWFSSDIARFINLLTYL